MKENNSTSTSTSTSSSYTVGGCNFIHSCKYRLPCGICDRTGEYCTDFFNYPSYPSWPNYPYYPSWKVTCDQNTSIDADHIKTGTITANTGVNL